MYNKEFFATMEQSIINYDKGETIRLASMALEKGIEPVAAINFINGCLNRE